MSTENPEISSRGDFSTYLDRLLARNALSEELAEVLLLRHTLVIQRMTSGFARERADLTSGYAQLRHTSSANHQELLDQQAVIESLQQKVASSAAGLAPAFLSDPAKAGRHRATLADDVIVHPAGRQSSSVAASASELEATVAAQAAEIALHADVVEALTLERDSLKKSFAESRVALEQSRALASQPKPDSLIAETADLLVDDVPVVSATGQGASNETLCREIIKEYQALYRHARKHERAAEPLTTVAHGVLHMPLIPNWTTLKLNPDGRGAVVNIVALAAACNGRIQLEYELGVEEAGHLKVIAQGAVAAAAGTLQQLLSLEEKRLFVLKLRKTKGVPCILRLELTTSKSKLTDVVDRTLKNGDDIGTLSSKAFVAANTPVAAPAGSTGKSVDFHANMKPQQGAILWQASNIRLAGDLDGAIRFAERHAEGLVKNAVNVLKANKYLNDEPEWVRHMNDYIDQFDIAPIELTRSAADRFYRLSTAPLPECEGGACVTVIMPAFNAGKHLDFTANSILVQTWRNLELIIVDDASSDDTWSIAQRIAAKDSRVKIFRNDVNVGPYVSKNLALRMAQGDFVTGHDADDWAHPQRIEKHVRVMLENRESLKASMTRMIRMGLGGQFDYMTRIGRMSDDGVLRDSSISTMFDRDFLVSKLGNWDCARFGADSELIFRSERLLGEGFRKLRQLGMICLNAEGSLTNDPVHGVSTSTGISPTRKAYRDGWMEWHKTLLLDDAYLSFPHSPRRFGVPDAAAVPDENVERNIKAHNLQASGIISAHVVGESARETTA